MANLAEMIRDIVETSTGVYMMDDNGNTSYIDTDAVASLDIDTLGLYTDPDAKNILDDIIECAKISGGISADDDTQQWILTTDGINFYALWEI